jgi:general secretion pathway protein N
MVPPVPEYAAILATPIFAPDRRPGPAEGSGSDGAGGSLAGYAALGAAVGPTVASVVISAPGGAIKTLRRGDEIGGWRLVAVDKTRAVFEHNGARHTLVVGAPAEPSAPLSGAAPTDSDDSDEAATRAGRQ